MSKNGAGEKNVRAADEDDERRRAELADFLRKRRASLQPEDVGLPPAEGRRRTPGLRREEVAVVSGVGSTWYTWLEQGRDVRASEDVLEAIARGMRMSDAEREHLLLLGRGNGSLPPAPPEEPSPALRRLVASLDPHPAYVVSARWDYICWNRALALAMGDPAELPEGRRNQLWRFFMYPERREQLEDWKAASRRLVARFRADYAHHSNDPAFTCLVEDLRERSPLFRKLWAKHEVAGTGDGTKRINHPEHGLLVFEHAVFRHAENPEHRLVLYSPDDATREKLEELLAADEREREAAPA
jgi:transcriptional regulator with XRE-family HTH domain